MPRISSALALGAIGSAYIIIPPKNDIRGEVGSIWREAEFPLLMASSRVDRAVRVDPEDSRSRLAEG